MPLSNLLIAATAFIPGVVGIQLPRRVPKSPTQGPSNSDTSDSSDSPASSNRRRALSNGSGFKWSPMRLFAPGGSSSSLNLTPTPSPRGFEAAPQRLRDPLPGQWAGPEHYKGGKVGDFIRGEIARVYREEEDEGAYVHGLELVSDEECPSTATLQQFNKQVVNLGLTGLYGCTSVVIVTSWGAWMSHLWEIPSFAGAILDNGAYDPELKRMTTPVVEDGDARAERFDNDVLLFIATQIEEKIFSASHNKPSSPIIFDDQSHPVSFFIVTPRESENAPAGTLRYPLEVKRLRDAFVQVWPDITTIDYVILTSPLNDASLKFRNAKKARKAAAKWGDQVSDKQCTTARGKILIQYQPAPSPGEFAKCRVFVEGTEVSNAEKLTWRAGSWSDGLSQVYRPQGTDAGATPSLEHSPEPSPEPSPSPDPSPEPSLTPIPELEEP